MVPFFVQCRVEPNSNAWGRLHGFDDESGTCHSRCSCLRTLVLRRLLSPPTLHRSDESLRSAAIPDALNSPEDRPNDNRIAGNPHTIHLQFEALQDSPVLRAFEAELRCSEAKKGCKQGLQTAASWVATTGDREASGLAGDKGEQTKKDSPRPGSAVGGVESVGMQ